MSSPDTLLKAALNRVAARIAQKVVDSAAELAVIAQDAPERLSQEWSLFQEEVFAEADRLEKESTEGKSYKASTSQSSGIEEPQDKIDQMRAQVAELSRKLEANN